MVKCSNCSQDLCSDAYIIDAVENSGYVDIIDGYNVILKKCRKCDYENKICVKTERAITDIEVY